MGHPVNPVSFRLGVVRGWNFTSSSLENNHHHFFFNSHCSNVLNFFKRLFNTKVAKKIGFIFSHITVSNAFNKQHYLIFFYDGPMQATYRFFYGLLRKKIFKQTLIRKNRLFLKEKFIKKGKDLYKVIFFSYKKQLLNLLLQKQNYILFLKRLLLETIVDILHTKFAKIFYKNSVKKEFFSLTPDEVTLSTFIFHSYLIEPIRNFLTHLLSKKFFENLKNFLEKKIKNLNILLNRTIFNIIKKKFFLYRLKARIKFFKLTLRMVRFSKKLKIKKLLFFNFFTKFLRSFLFTSFFRIFLHKFKKILFPYNFKHVTFTFKSITKQAITASVIAKYICVRLSQKYTVKGIVRPIIRDLVSNRYVAGFKISCCGRFTKKEIATFFWKKVRRVSLSRATSHIDYSFKEVVLKYSICGIKVWIQTKRKYPIRKYLWKLDRKFLKNKFLKTKKKLKKTLKKTKKIIGNKKIVKSNKYGFISKKNKIQKMF